MAVCSRVPVQSFSAGYRFADPFTSGVSLSGVCTVPLTHPRSRSVSDLPNLMLRMLSYQMVGKLSRHTVE